MPLKGKYLKYSPEITLEIFTLVWNKLIKNGCKFEYSKEIIFERFKFHDRVLRYDFNGNYVYPLMGSNSCKKTTVQEILGYDPFVKDDFVLPNKWCIKTTKDENGKLIGKWFDKQSMCRCYYDTCLGEYYNSYNLLNENIILGGNLAASFASLEVREGYTEITFDQFKKYVLKQNTKEDKEVIPKYVELLEGFDSTCTGKIFDTNQPIPQMSGWSNQWTWESIFKNDIQRSYFKPSTKEAFDAQNKPIEKWSVGGYVVFLKDHVNSTSAKKGDINLILDECHADNLTQKKPRQMLTFASYSEITDIKWFATKFEAEEFAKTLIESVKHGNGILDVVDKPQKLTIFPAEGHCKTNSIELRKYLTKRPNTKISREPKWIEGKSIGVGWNKFSHWIISEKSSKPEYSLDQLSKFLDYSEEKPKEPLKQAVHCTTQEEWDFVLSKFNPRNINNNLYKGLETILVINHPEKHFLGAFGTLHAANTGNYQILSFQEWCDLNGYKMEKEVDLTGRYLRALIDGPQSTVYKKGDAVKILRKESNNTYSIGPSLGGRWTYTTNNSTANQWELLPEDYKMEKEVKFEVGKWYKAYYAEKIYFLKYKNTIPRNGYNQINCSEFINNGVYKINDSISNTDLENSFKVLDDLEEIQQYLPDDHPDKIKIDSEFKVGDWVIIKSWYYDKNIQLGQIAQIKAINLTNQTPYELNMSIAPKGSTIHTWYFKLGEFRHATPEEINNHLISIGQIPDLDNQESKIYSFKPLQPNDLEWEVQISNPYSEVLIEQSNGRLDRSLSIFPVFEENPLIQITKFEINKNYFIDFKDPYN